MLMTRIRNDSRDRIGRFVPAFEQRPSDFAETFIRIGRMACEEHYGTGRLQITRWLEECGKAELKAKRCEQVKRNEIERNAGKRLSRRDVHRILEAALPVPDHRYVSPAIAQRAAHHLRICRNGGWIISPVGNGTWRLGLRVVSAAELVELAKRMGFSANLPGGE